MPIIQSVKRCPFYISRFVVCALLAMSLLSFLLPSQAENITSKAEIRRNNMPIGMTPTPSDSPVGQAKKGSTSSVAVIPFARASKWHIEQSNTQSGIALSANPQTFNYAIASYGYLSGLLITVQLSGGAGGSTLTFFEDSPWSLLQNLQVSDVNGVPLFQLSGFHAAVAGKFGGYRLFGMDGVLRGFQFDTAAGQAPIAGGPAASTFATVNGGYYQTPNAVTANTKFIIPVFFEFGTDGLGCLPNMDASARYNLQLTVAGGAAVASASGPYIATATTIPTTLPTMTITVEILARSQPPSQDMFGNMNSTSPPAVGTVQYWTNQTASGLASGANTIQLTRVGNLIRNHIFVFRDGTTNPPRSTAETAWMPSLFEFDWDTGQRFIANLATYRLMYGYGIYGMDVPNGVIALANTLDPDKIPISEYGDEWLATVGATKLTLRFTTSAAPGAGSSVAVLTNDIVPASSQVYQAPALLLG
jgi:hypothetical protein